MTTFNHLFNEDADLTTVTDLESLFRDVTTPFTPQNFSPAMVVGMMLDTGLLPSLTSDVANRIFSVIEAEDNYWDWVEWRPERLAAHIRSAMNDLSVPYIDHWVDLDYTDLLLEAAESILKDSGKLDLPDDCSAVADGSVTIYTIPGVGSLTRTDSVTVDRG